MNVSDLAIALSVIFTAGSPNAAAACGSDKLEIDYRRLGLPYNLRGEDKIRTGKFPDYWVTDCPVPIKAIAKAAAKSDCKSQKEVPITHLRISQEPASNPSSSDHVTLSLELEGKDSFDSTLEGMMEPGNVWDADEVMYAKTVDDLLVDGIRYHVFVYLSHRVDEFSTKDMSYKSYRLELFDTSDTKCLAKEPGVNNILSVPSKTAVTGDGSVHFMNFYRGASKLTTPPPVHIDETQVGDGSEPKRN